MNLTEKNIDTKHFLVEDNQNVIGVRIASGYMGMGGSNRSGFQANSSETTDYSLEELATCGNLWVYNMEIYALKNDTLYMRHTNENGEVKEMTLNCKEPTCTFIGDSISYDTYTAKRIYLILK